MFCFFTRVRNTLSPGTEPSPAIRQRLGQAPKLRSPCREHGHISTGGRCSGEADQEVAKASAADDTGRTFAVGSDSDFFIFERCRYIHFDDLKVCVYVVYIARARDAYVRGGRGEQWKI